MSIYFQNLQAVLSRLDAAGNPSAKKRVLSRLAREITSSSKRHVRDQKDLNNLPFTPRKSGKRKKLLTKLGAAIRYGNLTENAVEIGFFNPVMGNIAYKQQFGDTTSMTVEQAKRRPGQLPPSAPATKRQAAQLLEAGYKIRRARGGYKTPSKKWITDNMTIRHAGAVLHALRGGGVTAWSITIPARSFLGVTESELPVLMDAAEQEMNRQLSGN